MLSLRLDIRSLASLIDHSSQGFHEMERKFIGFSKLAGHCNIDMTNGDGTDKDQGIRERRQLDLTIWRGAAATATKFITNISSKNFNDILNLNTFV